MITSIISLIKTMIHIFILETSGKKTVITLVQTLIFSFDLFLIFIIFTLFFYQKLDLLSLKRKKKLKLDSIKKKKSNIR